MRWSVVDAGDAALAPSDDPSVARSYVAGAAVAGEAARLRDDVLAFVDAHDDALWRTCAPGHLTASALVVDATGTRTLVMLHTKLGIWVQPGGHADGEPNLARAAWLEATEETGIEGLRLVLPAIDVDVHRVDPPTEPAHLHHDIRFLAIAPPGATAVRNHESRELRWVGPDDLDALGADPGTHRLVRRGLDVAREITP
jgi:ADP-ribose pyrophosphatase YjhB (NUDIX family)